ncbi:hypothetical protein [Ekhidna sp.]|uniref:hypothetical protein n=1 Tax=Ekhidna sp. TaxID=2608089 RepID=UPI003B5C82DD
MKKSTLHYFIILSVIVIPACETGGSKTNGESSNDAAEAVEKPKDVSELAFMDIVNMVYPDSIGKLVEWHREEMPNSLIDSLEITEGEPCGEQGCGRTLLMTNNTDRAVGVLTKADFSIRDRQAYLAREYVLEAGQTIKIGCSHLCYNGEYIPFPRTIVGSWYMDE